jgi:transcriptional regulator with XRE-family HTH domain
MVIGDRLKELRESKDLSQGDIEKRTGLLRCYISRVEKPAYRPSGCDARRDGTGSGSAHVSVIP